MSFFALKVGARMRRVMRYSLLASAVPALRMKVVMTQ